MAGEGCLRPVEGLYPAAHRCWAKGVYMVCERCYVRGGALYQDELTLQPPAEGTVPAPGSPFNSARSVRSASPRKAPTPRFGRADSPRRQSSPRSQERDRVRGVNGMGASEARAFTSFGTHAPSAAQRSAAAAAYERQQREMKDQADSEAERIRREKARFAEKIKRATDAKRKADVAQKQREAAKTKAAKEAEEQRQQRASDAAAGEASGRAEWRRRSDAAAESEARRDAAAEAARRMRNRWKPPPRPPPRRKPADPYREWRGTVDGGDEEAPGWDSADDDDAAVDVSEANEEEAAQAAARRAKAMERDEAAQRILAFGSKTLMQALGLPAQATDAEVARCVRNVLRLLHPDYAINRCLAEGSRRQQRIEAAYKRLNGLRDSAG
jgi:hypothetical protein